MQNLKLYISIIILVLSIASCKNSTAQNKSAEPSTSTATTTPPDYSGNYVSSEYQKRNQGYDWVAVSVHNVEKGKISVSIRSRADKKRPTCTFDATAYQLNASTYKTVVDGKGILFSFAGKKITIAAEKASENGFLNYFCSGGATMAGSYEKINEPLDQKQIDKTSFSKLLTFNTFEFHLTAQPSGNMQKLATEIYGLKSPDTKVYHKFIGHITDAEIADLNNDGFPEVLVYIVSGDDHEGNVLCYSVNNGLSISQASFPETETNSQINNGYQGGDEFSVVENTLSQRFPVYEHGKETATVRQIDYTLDEGEACRVFKIKHISEFHHN